jgi:peptide/nickel transport system substrate-binding protein
MKRRTLLGTAAAALATPSVIRSAQAQSQRLLRFVPQADLANPDPVWSTTVIAAEHAFLIFDQLYGLDEGLLPQKQMVGGEEVSSDGLTWILTLRDGLAFHDGAPVRAADCIQSILRAARRTPIVETLMSQTNELSALDDKRLQFRLKKRYALLPFSLTGVFVMPERIAKTDAFTMISEHVGSGPYKFVPAEWKAGSGAVYLRNEAYVPRAEAISMWSGGKVANFDRVEWHTIPDPATAAAALQRGEVDWVEAPLIDLAPSLAKSAGVKVDVFDKLGSLMIMAFNHYQPPFDNVKLRRAVLAALDQTEFVDAVVGEQKTLGLTGVGVFPPASPYSSKVGLEGLNGPRDLAAAKKMVAESGYKGEPIVLMSPSDQPSIQQSAQVANALFKSLGLNVQYTSVDWGTMIQRRNSRELPEKGGWSCYCTSWVGLSVASPATHLPLRAEGEKNKAWWRATNERMEGLRDAWFAAPDLAAQKAICADMQREALAEVPFIPLGTSFQPTAFRDTLSGFAKSPYPVFWGVRKAGA